MMRLLSAPNSPFGRKVKMTAAIKGVLDRMTIENVDSTTPAGTAELSRENPLVKLPVLVLDNGAQLFDSHVICEYLDSLAPKPVLFPTTGAERFNTLTLGALGDGIMEAALTMVYEKRFRPEDKWVQSWLDKQQAKIDGGIAHLERNPPLWGQTPDYGHITIASALGYLDLRQEGRWRTKAPKMVKWLDQFAAATPAYESSKPIG
jgi:glutathione S-transferase